MTKGLPALPTTLILVVWLTGSCFTGKIYLSVLQPATVTVPGTIRSISILPIAGVPDPPGVFDSIRVAALDPAYDYNTIKKGFIYGLYDIISLSPRFDKVVITDSGMVAQASEGILSMELLQQICRHDSTDAALVLKKAVSYDTLLQDQTLFIYSGEGFDCALHYTVVSLTRWAFFLPESRLQAFIFSSTDTIYHYEEGGCYKIRSPRSMQELLYNACFFAGSEAGKKMVPVWDDQVVRYLFTGPDKELRKAARLALANQWADAGKIWYGLSQDPDSYLASRASFNIALAWERDDDLDQAYLWASHADSLDGNPKTAAYRKVLQERLQTREELDRQMLGE
jgi:hypothetical protein